MVFALGNYRVEFIFTYYLLGTYLRNDEFLLLVV